jgi:hypothetical protein
MTLPFVDARKLADDARAHVVFTTSLTAASTFIELAVRFE